MDKEEMLWIASLAIGKNIDYEGLYSSPYMCGNENPTDEVWEYVKECTEVGITAFKEKYKEYQLFI